MEKKQRCLDCHWCLGAANGAGNKQFLCQFRDRPLTLPMVWRPACKDYVPVVDKRSEASAAWN